ncbi:hypothetical protein [Virgibacillus sp. MG-45]|uniref:hypothetical protein n=1 Tax=Virgibacillus sp. MG-45 TaxID=3102791 RepID=UPI002EDB7A3B
MKYVQVLIEQRLSIIDRQIKISKEQLDELEIIAQKEIDTLRELEKEKAELEKTLPPGKIFQ